MENNRETDTHHCYICNKPDELTTAKDPFKGIMWEGITEVWVCHQCVRENSRKVPISF